CGNHVSRVEAMKRCRSGVDTPAGDDCGREHRRKKVLSCLHVSPSPFRADGGSEARRDRHTTPTTPPARLLSPPKRAPPGLSFFVQRRLNVGAKLLDARRCPRRHWVCIVELSGC